MRQSSGTDQAEFLYIFGLIRQYYGYKNSESLRAISG
jgi:hypothetical protein